MTTQPDPARAADDVLADVQRTAAYLDAHGQSDDADVLQRQGWAYAADCVRVIPRLLADSAALARANQRLAASEARLAEVEMALVSGFEQLAMIRGTDRSRVTTVMPTVIVQSAIRAHGERARAAIATTAQPTAEGR